MRRCAVVVLGISLACAGACSGGPTPEEQLRRAVIDFNGHIVIMKSTTDFAEYREVIARSREEQGVVSGTPFLFVEGLLNVRGKMVAIAVKGVAPDQTAIGKMITPLGVLARYRPHPPAEPVHAVIGVKLARELDVKVGDVIDFLLPPPLDSTTFEPTGAPPTRHPLRIVGTLASGAEYDERTLLTTFEALQTILGQGDRAMGVELRIKDERAAARVATALRERLGAPPYVVMDWCELNEAALTCKLD